MKRIAFAAAAALLGTGCISSTTTTNPPPPQQYGSVNLYWSFQKYAPAQTSGYIDYDTTYTGPANGPCVESAVETVTVDSPVGTQTVDCVHTNGVQGLGIDAIPAGNQTFRFRGNRGGYVVYDSTVTLLVVAGTTAGTATSYYVPVEGTWAPFDMFAYLAYGGAPGTLYATCGAAAPAGSGFVPDIGYWVNDVHGNLVETGLVACSDPLPAAVFVGDLDLDNYDIRMQGFRHEDSALVFDSCWQPFDHFTADTGANGFAPVLYTNPIPVCP